MFELLEGDVVGAEGVVEEVADSEDSEEGVCVLEDEEEVGSEVAEVLDVLSGSASAGTGVGDGVASLVEGVAWVVVASSRGTTMWLLKAWMSLRSRHAVYRDSNVISEVAKESKTSAHADTVSHVLVLVDGDSQDRRPCSEDGYDEDDDRTHGEKAGPLLLD